MAAFDRSAPVLPEVPGHRLTAIAASVAGHAILIALLIAAGRYAVEEESEPVRMVFVEPAPPPKLGAPDGGAAAAAAPAAQAAPAALEPAAPAPPEQRTYVAEPALYPPRPEPRREPRPKPAPAVKPAAKPAAQAKPAPAPERAAGRAAPVASAPAGEGIAGATSADPRGVADGVAAGKEGGLAGGQVGGLGDEVVPVGRAAVSPTIARRVMPTYPEVARLRDIEGQVVLEVVIATDGTVEPGIKVIHSIPALDAAAVDALRRWRFNPGRDPAGKPLRVLLQVPVSFQLR